MQQRLTPFLFRMAGLCLCLLIFCAVLAGTAESGHAAPVPVARKVLILYSGAAGQLETDNPWRRAFAMPGNYFGLLSFYQDVANPLPAKLDPAEWRAVVCAYSALTVDDPEGLIRWLWLPPSVAYELSSSTIPRRLQREHRPQHRRRSQGCWRGSASPLNSKPPPQALCSPMKRSAAK